MNFRFKIAATALLAVSVVAAYGQSTAMPMKKHHSKKPAAPTVEEQIQALRQEMEGQIDSLKSSLANKDAELKQAQEAAADAQAAAAKAQAAVDSQQQAVTENNAAVSTLSTSVSEIKSANAAVMSTVQDVQEKSVKKSELGDLAFGKVKISALLYADYAYYNKTGFGPQFLTQLNQTGPNNDGFNSFDITRTYLNFLYTPTPDVTLRITPNIYRMVDNAASAIADGSGSQIGASTNGNLGFRLKYAYLQFNHPFKKSAAFGKDYIRFGQTMNPLVDWEEGLYGYRFVNLTPWNYLSLSSTYTGAIAGGPVMAHGKEILDYQIGAFNTASFHSIEQSDLKQGMMRLTWYPMGTKVDRTGLGLTVFENYGYNTKTPDTNSTADNRLAILAHYQSTDKKYEIVGEYDLGHNAFSTGNLFSGAGPVASTSTTTAPYGTFNSLATDLLAGAHTEQQGFAFFGHAQLGKSPLSVFGMYHYFQPNTNIKVTDPLDFGRTVAGLSWAYNKYLTIALDDQNLTYVHSQFTMTPAQIATFNSALATANPSGIANAVPTGTNAIFLNMQFSY